MKKMKNRMCLLLAVLLMAGVMLASCDEMAILDTPTGENTPPTGNEPPANANLDDEQVDPTKSTYDAALACLEQGKTEEAYALFLSIPEYRDVSEHLERFVYRYGKQVTHSKTYGGYKNSYLFEFQYNQYGQVTEQIHDSEILWRIYDDKGNCSRVFYQDGSALYYTYDEQGNIVKQEHYHAALGKGTYYDTYSYDEQGHMVERCHYNDSETRTTRQTYAYDEAGNKIEWVVLIGDVEQYRYEYTYDEVGNLLSEKYTIDDDWKLIEREYNAKNQMTRETRTSSNGYDYEYRMEYDEHGNITRREEDYGTNTELTVYEYTNEYDDEGRLIKKTMMLDSELSAVRAYEYDENGNVMRDTRHEYVSGQVNYYCIDDYLDYQLYYNPFIGHVDPLADMDFGGK